jgi:membrane protein
MVKQTFSEFSEDNVLRLSAALAYYAIFSIGPFLAIVVGVAGILFGAESVRHQIEQQLQGMMGEGATRMVDSMMSARHKGTGIVTTIIGVVVLLVGAAGVFGQLQDSLNTIWEVKSKPGAGIWNLVRKRFLSFSMVLGVGFLLLVSLALSTALTALSGRLHSLIHLPEWTAHTFDFVLSFAVITVLFAAIFKFLPDVKIGWRKVWVGAIGTSLLFALGKYLLGFYLGRESTASAYGAAGSVIVILMWVYYASVILFFGAEFTQVYARQTGAKISPSKYAVPVTEEQRAQEGMPDPEKVKRPRRAEVIAHTRSPESERPDAKTSTEPQAPVPAKTTSALATRAAGSNALDLIGWVLVAGLATGALLKFKFLRKAVVLSGDRIFDF